MNAHLACLSALARLTASHPLVRAFPVRSQAEENQRLHAANKAQQARFASLQTRVNEDLARLDNWRVAALKLAAQRQTLLEREERAARENEALRALVRRKTEELSEMERRREAVVYGFPSFSQDDITLLLSSTSAGAGAGATPKS